MTRVSTPIQINWAVYGSGEHPATIMTSNDYVSSFLPNIMAYMAPLQSMMQNRAPFFWRPLHQWCFEMIKHICYKMPVIQPLDYKSDEPVWLICDASKTGVGAMYGQGPSWTKCRPAGFALLKWEDKLIGRKVHIIMDHKALEFFKTQARLSNRQWRWMDYMSKFEFNITYIKGELNKVADCFHTTLKMTCHQMYMNSMSMYRWIEESIPMERTFPKKDTTKWWKRP